MTPCRVLLGVVAMVIGVVHLEVGSLGLVGFAHLHSTRHV